MYDQITSQDVGTLDSKRKSLVRLFFSRCTPEMRPISHAAIDFFSDQYVQLSVSLHRDFDIFMQLRNT